MKVILKEDIFNNGILEYELCGASFKEVQICHGEFYKWIKRKYVKEIID